MFSRPTGFSDTFTATHVQILASQQEVAYQQAKLAEQSQTTFSVIDSLCSSSKTSEDKVFLEKLKSVCQEIFSCIENAPRNSNAIELKAKISAMASDTIKMMTIFAKSMDDEDIQHVLRSRMPSLIQKEVNRLYDNFLEHLIPPDDSTFHAFFKLRTDPKIQNAKDEALDQINKLLSKNKSSFFSRREVLLCINLNSVNKYFPEGFEETWIVDLMKDLEKVEIRTNTLESALEKANSPSHLSGSYLNGSGLPTVMVVFATSSLHERKSSGSPCSNINELWHDAMEGMGRNRRKIIPVRLGVYQTFWPKGREYHNDFQEHLLTQFPVARKGYHNVLFNEVIKSFFNSEEELKMYSEIIENFNKKTNIFLEGV